MTNSTFKMIHIKKKILKKKKQVIRLSSTDVPRTIQVLAANQTDKNPLPPGAHNSRNTNRTYLLI